MQDLRDMQDLEDLQDLQDLLGVQELRNLQDLQDSHSLQDLQHLQNLKIIWGDCDTIWAPFLCLGDLFGHPGSPRVNRGPSMVFYMFQADVECSLDIYLVSFRFLFSVISVQIDGLLEARDWK